MKALLKTFILVAATMPFTASAKQIHEGFKDSCNDRDGLCNLYEIVITDDGAILEDTVINHGGGVTEHVEGDPTKGVICSKRALVPRPVYKALMNSMNNIAVKTAESGSAELTQAEKTMLLFYNTLMQQFANFDCR
jgi:hypothetical protein